MAAESVCSPPVNVSPLGSGVPIARRLSEGPEDTPGAGTPCHVRPTGRVVTTMTDMTVRTRGSALKATLTQQEYKRLDALFQTKALVREMGEAERMLIKLVKEARKQGATWQEVAESMGVTQQSAYSKYYPLVEGKAMSQRARAGRSPRVAVKHEEQQSLAI